MEWIFWLDLDFFGLNWIFVTGSDIWIELDFLNWLGFLAWVGFFGLNQFWGDLLGFLGWVGIFLDWFGDFGLDLWIGLFWMDLLDWIGLDFLD